VPMETTNIFALRKVCRMGILRIWRNNMGKMKELLLEIVEAYDYNGLTIKQISDTYGMPEDQVIAILSEHSMTFA